MSPSPARIVARAPWGAAVVLAWAALGLAVARHAAADGLVVAPRDYSGSLEEREQEAIIIFDPGDETHRAREDLILKIRVLGDVAWFAWVVPLPAEPVTGPEDPALFEQLHRYVTAQRAAGMDLSGKGETSAGAAKTEARAGVEVLSRRVVGSYDVAVVREAAPGSLNDWLRGNGYRAIEHAEDLIDSYRKRGYVFACVRVSEAARAEGADAVLHPLRFSFSTNGRDGIYFPMRLTGLQTGPFGVTLYVFYNKWLNDRLSRFGYIHRGFALDWRDYDGPKCVPNAGKGWSDPEADPYLRPFAPLFPVVTKLFQKLHPGERYYLTKLGAFGLKPRDVRAWSDDLWLFPYYTDARMVPYDARPGRPASLAYPTAAPAADPPPAPVLWRLPDWKVATVAGVVVLVAIALGHRWLRTAIPLHDEVPRTGNPKSDR